MNKQDAQEYLRFLDLKLLERQISDEELSLLQTCLMHVDEEIMSAAALIISELELENLLIILNHFNDFSDKAKRVLSAFLMSSEQMEVYRFFFSYLQTCTDLGMKEYLIICLQKTQYFIFPMLVSRLDDAEGDFLETLKKILRKKGINYSRPFLSMYPQIPNEAIFREIFGDESIDSIKSDRALL